MQTYTNFFIYISYFISLIIRISQTRICRAVDFLHQHRGRPVEMRKRQRDDRALFCKGKNEAVAQYPQTGYAQLIGVSDYQLSKAVPENPQ